MDKIRVAILGAGTVGTGVYKLINKQADEMIHKVGANIEIAKILVRIKLEMVLIQHILLTILMKF